MTYKQAIISCSGGIDSVVLAHYIKKKSEYDRIKIVFFDYGQKTSKKEKICAKECSRNIGAKFICIDLRNIGNNYYSLLNKSGQINKISKKDLKDTSNESKKFYFPMRNTLFISILLGLAETDFIKNKIENDIYLGFKSEGNEPYPDTTKSYLRDMNRLSKKITCYNVKIKAPFIEKDKEDIILLGKKLGVDFSKTHSCYINNKACGYCLACALRKSGFYWAGELE